MNKERKEDKKIRRQDTRGERQPGLWQPSSRSPFSAREAGGWLPLLVRLPQASEALLAAERCGLARLEGMFEEKEEREGILKAGTLRILGGH